MSNKFYKGVIFSCITLSIFGVIFYLFRSSSARQIPIYKGTMLLAKEVKIGDTKTKPFENTVENEVVPEDSEKTLSLLAVGDIMLDRSVMLKTQAAQNYNHPFLLIDPLFKEYNLHLANLEGPITNYKSVANGTGGARFTFTFSPKFVDPLKNRFQFLSLANNHEYNFGQDGVNQTRKFLSDAGIRYFGDPSNTASFISVTSSYNGITLAFIGYHQLVEKGFDRVLSEIKRIRSEVDIVIAMPHWGLEYVTNTPSFLQKKEAHDMVDAGVDVIMGTHPHVIQPIEIYKEKVIFYSLGNFVFDQYFSEETETGLAVGMLVQKVDGLVKTKYKLIPLDISGQSQVSRANTQKTEKTLQGLSRYSLVPENTKEEIKSGEIFVEK